MTPHIGGWLKHAEEPSGPPPRGLPPVPPHVARWLAEHECQVVTERFLGGCVEGQLTEPERKAVVMALRARMRTEAGTFHELLRRAVEKLDRDDDRSGSVAVNLSGRGRP